MPQSELQILQETYLAQVLADGSSLPPSVSEPCSPLPSHAASGNLTRLSSCITVLPGSTSFFLNQAQPQLHLVFPVLVPVPLFIPVKINPFKLFSCLLSVSLQVGQSHKENNDDDI
ncbi:hypothetical protein ILYODFUR_013583 [Ilyodon furcidens]|uniref:Uncharacterized protein n=1 Tax=Ilyodon furcidens TaxID=33524 RepID=A0ABV0V4S9_9TELE